MTLFVIPRCPIGPTTFEAGDCGWGDGSDEDVRQTMDAAYVLVRRDSKKRTEEVVCIAVQWNALG